jgi:hypothetical protein
MQKRAFIQRLFAITLGCALIVLVSCKSRQTDNTEELARRTSRPEAVMVEIVRLEPSTIYHEIIRNIRIDMVTVFSVFNSSLCA